MNIFTLCLTLFTVGSNSAVTGVRALTDFLYMNNLKTLDTWPRSIQVWHLMSDRLGCVQCWPGVTSVASILYQWSNDVLFWFEYTIEYLSCYNNCYNTSLIKNVYICVCMCVCGRGFWWSTPLTHLYLSLLITWILSAKPASLSHFHSFSPQLQLSYFQHFCGPPPLTHS